MYSLPKVTGKIVKNICLKEEHFEQYVAPRMASQISGQMISCNKKTKLTSRLKRVQKLVLLDALNMHS